MNPPQTVKELNAAIISSFGVLECSKAFETFPFTIQSEGQELNIAHRVECSPYHLKVLKIYVVSRYGMR